MVPPGAEVVTALRPPSPAPPLPGVPATVDVVLLLVAPPEVLLPPDELVSDWLVTPPEEVSSPVPELPPDPMVELDLSELQAQKSRPPVNRTVRNKTDWRMDFPHSKHSVISVFRGENRFTCSTPLAMVRSSVGVGVGPRPYFTS